MALLPISNLYRLHYGMYGGSRGGSGRYSPISRVAWEDQLQPLRLAGVIIFALLPKLRAAAVDTLGGHMTLGTFGSTELDSFS
jgi:hypothetical protein